MSTAPAFHSLPTVDVEEYHERGYTIVRNVFRPDEIADLKLSFDRAYAEGMTHRATWRHQNRVFWVHHKEGVGRFINGCQWQSWVDPVLNRVRTDPRMLALVEPLIGNNLKQIINQLHWKVPKTGFTWGMHQDVRNRTPAHCFRDLANSYVQTGLGIDRHWAGNGAMKVIPFSHRRGNVRIADERLESYNAQEDDVKNAGIDPAQAVDVELNEGDVALWGPFMVHGGGFNTTEDNYRRLYINGYVKAENCERGQPTFHHGQPVPLTIPALVQYGELYVRPEPHYATDAFTLTQRD